MKIQGEIVGSAIYSALTTFLANHPEHTLDFTDQQLTQIEQNFSHHLEERLSRLEMSFFRVRGLSIALKHCSAEQHLRPLLDQIDQWFTDENWDLIIHGVTSIDRINTRDFLTSIQKISDDYALAYEYRGYVYENSSI